ncbi:hypothetical protein HN51_014853, partial [Arachis hypogaea]
MGERAVIRASMALRMWRGLSIKEEGDETKEVEKVVVVVIVVNKTIAHACVDEGNDDYLITGLERSHGCLRRRKKRE